MCKPASTSQSNAQKYSFFNFDQLVGRQIGTYVNENEPSFQGFGNLLVAEAAALGWHLAGWLATVTISTPVVATVSVPVKACPIKRAR